MVPTAIVVSVCIKLDVLGRNLKRPVQSNPWLQSDCAIGYALRVGIASRCTVLCATASGRSEDRPGFTSRVPVAHGAYGRPPSPRRGAVVGSASVVEYEASSTEERFS